MHKKIIKKAAKDLKKDADLHSEHKHSKVNKKEALSAAKDMKMRAKKSHER